MLSMPFIWNYFDLPTPFVFFFYLDKCKNRNTLSPVTGESSLSPSSVDEVGAYVGGVQHCPPTWQCSGFTWQSLNAIYLKLFWFAHTFVFLLLFWIDVRLRTHCPCYRSPIWVHPVLMRLELIWKDDASPPNLTVFRFYLAVSMPFFRNYFDLPKPFVSFSFLYRRRIKNTLSPLQESNLSPSGVDEVGGGQHRPPMWQCSGLTWQTLSAIYLK